MWRRDGSRASVAPPAAACRLPLAMIRNVRWVVTLQGTTQDIERLLDEFSELSAVEDASTEYHRDVRLQLDDPEGDAPDEDGLNVARAAIEAYVRRINGFGRLRWGRMFESVEIMKFQTVDSGGETTTILFLERGVEDLVPEDWVAMADERAIPRAKLPVGMEALSVLNGEAVTMLGATDHSVGLVLRLVDGMLSGDEQIDWGAAYSALEVIEQDLRERRLKGQDVGWWTAKEMENFKATANSVEVLGERARHGKPFGLTEARMTSANASWLVRRVAALWLTWRLERGRGSSE